MEKDVLPHPNAASADSNGVGEPTEKAVSSDPNAASPDSNTPKRSPKLLRRLDRTSAVLENIKDNKDALKIADRNISKWNREIGTCNIQLNRINGLIRWHESAQYETPQSKSTTDFLFFL